jgi:hypothetical protein
MPAAKLARRQAKKITKSRPINFMDQAHIPAGRLTPDPPRALKHIDVNLGRNTRRLAAMVVWP